MRLTAKQISEAIGRTVSLVQKRAVKEAWTHVEVPGTGGLRKEYPIDQLPAEIQKAIAKKEAARGELAPVDTERKDDPPWAEYFKICWHKPGRPSEPPAVENMLKMLPIEIDAPSYWQGRSCLHGSSLTAKPWPLKWRRPKNLPRISG